MLLNGSYYTEERLFWILKSHIYCDLHFRKSSTKLLPHVIKQIKTFLCETSTNCLQNSLKMVLTVEIVL